MQKATRTARPFDAPAAGGGGGSDSDPRRFVSAIAGRDTPRVHPGDRVDDTLLAAAPLPPMPMPVSPTASGRPKYPAPAQLDLAEAEALAAAAVALASLEKPARGVCLRPGKDGLANRLLETTRD